MYTYLPIILVIIPIVTGLLIFAIPFKKEKHRNIFVEIMVCVNSCLAIPLIIQGTTIPVTLLRFTGNLVVSLEADGLSRLYITLLALFWPLATLYSFEYMEHEEHKKSFFAFYTITYGITMGIALSSNLLSLYFFYELLTLVTFPLVMHPLSREAILAARKYLYYSIGGAAFAFIGVIFIIVYGQGHTFMYGGILDLVKIGDRTNILLIVYIMAFFGFGVKAAVLPFNSWLPQAGVAPTPVTALLHAVAVVNSGAFALMRLTYYSFGADFLINTWVQKVAGVAVMLTIVYGCSRALKETHLKRRLAFSTISNLSYILFGVVLMTPAGLQASVAHMFFHGFMKMTAFLSIGSVMHITGRKYVHEINGLGYKMPITFITFSIAGLSLMGVPGLCGFISKWLLAGAAIDSGNTFFYWGIPALLISALLTGMYMLSIVVRAFFPHRIEENDACNLIETKDPGWKMLLPGIIFSIAIILFGLHPEPILQFIDALI